MTTTLRATKASAAAHRVCQLIEASGGRPNLEAYYCPAGVPTIGFGYAGKIVDKLTGQLREIKVGKWIDVGNGEKKYVDGDVIDLREAVRLYEVAAQEAERRVDFFFPTVPLSQGMRDALFLFCYNLRWKSIAESTLRRMINNGPQSAANPDGWTRESLIQWWIKYRNPKSSAEQGLFRRRITELCIAFDCDPEVARAEAWEAELVRDPYSKEIVRITDPELILLRAETKTEAKKIAAAERDAALAESRPPEAAEIPSPDAGKPTAGGATEKAPEAPTAKPAPAPKPKPAALPGQPATTADGADIRKDPQFWTMMVLVFGRTGLAIGFIPAAFSDLIQDKNFQVALAGIIAIYAAMLIAWAQERQKRKKAERAEAEAAE